MWNSVRGLPFWRCMQDISAQSVYLLIDKSEFGKQSIDVKPMALRLIYKCIGCAQSRMATLVDLNSAEELPLLLLTPPKRIKNLASRVCITFLALHV